MSNLKVSLGAIKDSRNALGQLLDLDLPAKVSYWLARTADEAERQHSYWDKARVSIIRKLGEPCVFTKCPKCERMIPSRITTSEFASSEGKPTFCCGEKLEVAGQPVNKDDFFMPDDDAEAWAKFNAEIVSLNAQQVDLPMEQKLKISDLGDVKIRPRILVPLDYLFDPS